MPFLKFKSWRSSKEKWAIRNGQLDKSFHRKLDEIGNSLVAGNMEALDAIESKVNNARRVLQEWEEHVDKHPKFSRGARKTARKIGKKRKSLEVVAATTSQLSNLLKASDRDK